MRHSLAKDQTCFNSSSHGLIDTQKRGMEESKNRTRKEKVIEPVESLKLIDEVWCETHPEDQEEKKKGPAACK